MKSFSLLFLPGRAVALLVAFAAAVLAQEPTKSGAAGATPASDTPAPAVAAPAAEPTPAPATAPTPPADAQRPAVTDENTESDKTGLRRIDQPIPDAPKSGARRRTESRGRSGRSGEFPIGDHTVAKGSEMREAISVFGSTTVEGAVRSDAVAVMGDTRVGPDGTVGGAAVAVLGRLQVDGEVRQDAVSVLGGLTINGVVGKDAVSVLGDVVLGPKAVIGGDLVVVGGKLTKDPGAVVRGNEVNLPGLGSLGSIEWLTTWLKQCALKGRPLGFGPHLGFAWLMAVAFLGFYLLLALLFPKAIEKCAVTLETRPGGSILASVLTVLLSPIATVLLAVTIIGALVVPFLMGGLFIAGLFGKAVMLTWIGRRFTKFFGDGPLGHPVFAVLIGGVLVMLLYTVWGSFLLYKLLSWLGLGVVVYTIALSMKREKPAKPTGGAPVRPMAPPVANIPSVAAMSVPVPSVSSPGFVGADVSQNPASSGFAAGMGMVGETVPPVMGGTSPSIAPVVRSAATPAPDISANTLPRAGFFLRLAALAIDGILLGMIVGFTSSLLPRVLQFNHGPGGVLLALAIYGAVMWKNKGTTIGGIVCGLKVVRLDQREIDWATAIVRALACFLSLVPAGLGFIWVAIDEEKQSWHDKIAGTTVVIVPKGQSLL